MADEQKDRRIECTSGSAAWAVGKLLIFGGQVQLDYWLASALGLVVLADCMLLLADYLAVVADSVAVAVAVCKELAAVAGCKEVVDVAGNKEVLAGLQTRFVAEV